MERKEPLERLRNRLLVRGLPAAYVSRAVQELADHHADLVEGAAERPTGGATQAWQRLGDIEQLGDELVRKYHARTFAGRHPLLTFVVAPLPALILLWVAMFFGTWAGIFAVAGWLGNEFDRYADTDFVGAASPLPMWLLLSIHYAVFYIPPAAGAWWFCRLATKSGRGIVWGTASSLLITALALFAFCEIQPPHDGQLGTLIIGLWVPLFHKFIHVERQLLQVVAPLAILAYAIWQARGLERTEISLPIEKRVTA